MKHLLWTIFILGILSFIWAVFVEPYRLKIKTYQVKKPSLSGLKIALVSDLHINPHQQKWLEEVVSKVNEQKPDIILLGGDFVKGHKLESSMDINKIAKNLGNLKAKYGIYAVLGNHDWWYGGQNVAQALEQNGIKVLNNQNILIPNPYQDLYLAGVEDATTRAPNLFEALNNTQEPVILLSHNPDIFPKIPPCTTLTLSGHTHGGEIYVPIFGAPFIPSKFNLKYRKNYVVENNKHLYVSGGIGTLSGFRTFNPPEIVILTLNQQTKKNKITNTPIKKNFFKNHFKVPAILK